MLGYQEIKIYTLVEHVVAAKLYPWSQDPFIAVYQKLFITQAALCQMSLDLQLQGEPSVLVMTPVGAYLEQSKPCNGLTGTEAANAARLQPNTAFFFNEANFEGVTAASVQGLLSEFWKEFDVHEGKGPALEVLNLGADASWPQIHRRYRALISLAHPDKGGSESHFIAVRAAYETLKRCYSSSSGEQ